MFCFIILSVTELGKLWLIYYLHLFFEFSHTVRYFNCTASHGKNNEFPHIDIFVHQVCIFRKHSSLQNKLLELK